MRHKHEKGAKSKGAEHAKLNLSLKIKRIQRKKLLHISTKCNKGNKDYIQFKKPNHIWGKLFKTGPSKICGRQVLKNLKGYGMLETDYTSSNVLNAVLHKFYLVHS